MGWGPVTTFFYRPGDSYSPDSKVRTTEVILNTLATGITFYFSSGSQKINISTPTDFNDMQQKYARLDFLTVG